MSNTTPTPNRLQRLRESAEQSPEEIAVKFGVSKETVVYWERENIPSKWLRPLASHFRVSIDFLLGEEEEAA